MAYLDFNLQPGEEKPITFQGRHINVILATSEFKLDLPGTPELVLQKNDYTLLDDSSTQRLTGRIKNISALANIIRLHEANVFVRKRQSSDIADTIIAIEDGEIIGIDPSSNAVQVQNEIIINNRAKNYSDLASVTIGDSAPGEGVIAANASRSELIITADESNAATVWLSTTNGRGVPLVAGEKAVLNVTSAVNLRGTDNDVVHVAQITL